MLNLNVYTGKDIQNFLSFLNAYESEGLTDTRFLREKIQRYIDLKYQTGRMRKYKKVKLCPECKIGMIKSENDENLNIVVCPKCRYSEIIK